jgi:hypothetical protein
VRCDPMLSRDPSQHPDQDQHPNLLMVSIVIPTRDRPHLLRRAIRSVLVQTHQDFEVVVVLDGVDAESAAAVEEFREPRIRLLTLPQRSGGAAARNAGVAAARGRWIAFLDDDDEFIAEKLALQLQSALRSDSAERTLTVCKAKVVENRITRVWPTRFPAPGERVVEYLFCRKGLRQGEAFLQSSTFFVSRALALRIPFRQDLKRHQDWDWAAQLQREAGVEIVAVPQVLTVYHRDDGPSVTRQISWEESLHWAKEVVWPESPKAHSFFIATQCVTRLDAEQCWKWRVLRRLFQECFGSGKATLLSAVLFTYFWMRALYKSLAAQTGKRETPGMEFPG